MRFQSRAFARSTPPDARSRASADQGSRPFEGLPRPGDNGRRCRYRPRPATSRIAPSDTSSRARFRPTLDLRCPRRRPVGCSPRCMRPDPCPACATPHDTYGFRLTRGCRRIPGRVSRCAALRLIDSGFIPPHSSSGPFGLIGFGSTRAFLKLKCFPSKSKRSPVQARFKISIASSVRPTRSFARYLKDVELFTAITHADPESQPAVRNNIDRRGIFGQAQGMIERPKEHEAADLHAFGTRRHRGHYGHDRREVAVVDKMMLGGPDGVEASLVEIFDLLEHRCVEISVRKLR